MTFISYRPDDISARLVKDTDPGGMRWRRRRRRWSSAMSRRCSVQGQGGRPIVPSSQRPNTKPCYNSHIIPCNMPTKPYHAILIKNYSLERQTKLSWRFRLYHHTKSGSTCDPYKLFLGKLVTRHVRACNTCPYHTSRPTKNHYNEKIIPQYKPTPYQGMCLIRKNNMLCRPNGRRSNETDFAQIHFLITFRL